MFARHPRLVATLLLGFATVSASARPAVASCKETARAAQEGCRWECFSDGELGLAAWVQRCDYGFRKIDFLKVRNALAIRYSDGGAPDPVIEVFDLMAGEEPEAGLRRLFVARTDKAIAKRCVLRTFREGDGPAGVRRYGFVPDAAYEKELAKTNVPGEIPEPPCGEWGDVADGIQYWETHPAAGARKVLFVRAGQDEPLFDENTLEILEGK